MTLRQSINTRGAICVMPRFATTVANVAATAPLITIAKPMARALFHGRKKIIPEQISTVASHYSRVNRSPRSHTDRKIVKRMLVCVRLDITVSLMVLSAMKWLRELHDMRSP